MRNSLFAVIVLMSGLLNAQPYYKQDSALSAGYSLLYHGSYDDAGKLFFQALKEAQQSGNRRIEAEAYRLLGEVNRASSNRPYAIKYLDEAEGIFSEIQDEYGIASTKNRKAAVYFEMGDSLMYMKYLQSSLKIARANGFRDIAYNSLTILGAVEYLNAKDYPKAIITLKEALNIARELEKVEDYPYIYNNLSRIYQETNMLDSALVYAEGALALGEEYNIPAYIASACGRLSLIYSAKGEYEKAYGYERRFNEIHDTLNLESRDKVVGELVEKYQNEKQEVALDRQNSQLRYMFFAGLILLLLLILMFVLYRNNWQHRLRLAEINEKIENQKSELEENNAVKDRLLSVLSHDLRSPVAALSSSLEILREGYVSAEDSAMLLEELSVRVERTSQLLDNLLFWIKNQLNKIQPEKQNLSLNDLVLDSLALLDPAIQQKGIHIKNNISEGFEVCADKEMLRMAIRNLLNNAVKFSDIGGWIDLSTAKTDTEILFSIKDGGIGMSQETIQDIFSLDRAGTRGTHKESGMGIGLSLVRDFLQANGASIHIESELNKGTTVQLSFPI